MSEFTQKDYYKIVNVGEQADPETGDCSSIAGLLAKEIAEMKDGFAVCWLWHEVLFGRLEEGVPSFWERKSPDFDRDLREIRLFNKERELYAYRSGKGFKYRRRKDADGAVAEYIEAKQVLWGTRAEPDGEWTILSESRGVRFALPLILTGVDPEHRVAILTRNYIGESENGQAGIVDCRFVDFIFGPLEE